MLKIDHISIFYSQLVSTPPSGQKKTVIAGLKLTHSCCSYVCPPGGAGELQHSAFQESPTRAGRRRGESRHRRDDCQQAADSNPRTDCQGRHGESHSYTYCCLVSVQEKFLISCLCFCRSLSEALLPLQTPSVCFCCFVVCFSVMCFCCIVQYHGVGDM